MATHRQAWEQAVGQVEELLRGGHLLDPARAQQVLSHALGYQWELSNVERLGGVPNEDMRQRVSRLARLAGEQLQQLDAQLAADGLHTLAPVPERRLTAGIGLAQACDDLLHKAQIGGQDLYRLAAAAISLVCGSGRRYLQQAVSASAPLGSIQCNLQGQMLLMTLTRANLSAPWAAAILPAVARTAAKPSALLPWLVTAGRTLEFLHSQLGPDDQQQLLKPASGLLANLGWTFEQEAFQLGPALAGQPQHQRQVLDIALSAVGLVVQQAKELHPCPADTLERLCRGLQVICLVQLKDAIEQLISSGGAMQLVTIAADALRLLLASGASLNDERRAESCIMAVRLAGVAVAGGPHMLGTGTSTSGVWAPELIERIVQLAPHVAAAVRLCARSGVLPPDGHELGLALHYSRAVLQLLWRERVAFVVTASQAADWCHAADACLSQLPLLSTLHTEWRSKGGDAAGVAQLGDTHPAQASAALGSRVLTMWRLILMAVGDALDGCVRDWAAGEAMSEALWQLHTTACRLLHWAAGQDEEQQAALPELSSWSQLLPVAVYTFERACLAGTTLSDMAHESGQEDRMPILGRRTQAICAAQSQLLPVLAAKQGQTLDQLLARPSFSQGMWAVVTGTPPLLLTPELMAAFEQGMRQQWQAASDDPNRLWKSVCTCTMDAASRPHYAAQLFNSGLLVHGLQLALRAGQPTNDDVLLTSGVLGACGCLAGAAGVEFGKQGSSSSSSSSSSAAGALPTLVASVATLQEGFQQVEQEGGLLGAPSSTQLLRLYQRTLIPPATQLAEALQAWWAEPEQQAAERLQAAQVAATRSCAYLRCANLGREGGPAAGQGKGSKRCGGCRSVYYCDTTCSGADWRAGHRRVCRALAAARAAAREEAGQAGARQGEEEAQQEG